MLSRTRLFFGVSFAACLQAAPSHGEEDGGMCFSVCTLPPMTITAGEGNGRPPSQAGPAPRSEPARSGTAFTQTGMDTLVIGLSDPLTREAAAADARAAVEEPPLAALVSRPPAAAPRRDDVARTVSLSPLAAMASRDALNETAFPRLDPARLPEPVAAPANPDPGSVYVPGERTPLVAVTAAPDNLQRLRRMSDDARTAGRWAPMDRARRELDRAWGAGADLTEGPEAERPSDDTAFFGLR